MLPKFLSYLNEEKNKQTEIYNQFVDDSFLNPIQTKFISLDLSGTNNANNESQSGDSRIVLRSNKSTLFGGATHGIAATDFESIYRKVNGLVVILKNRSHDLAMQTVRDIFFLDIEKYIGVFVDLNRSQYFLYTTLSIYHHVNPFFPNHTFIINDVNNTTMQTTVAIINLTAKESVDNYDAIDQLLHHIVVSNVPNGGDLVLYFYFAPWIEKHTKSVIEYLVNNFEQVTVLFPLIFLPITNKCFYICKNKLERPSASKLNQNVFNQTISFSKQVAFHVLNDLNILISLLNFKIESEEAFGVTINKIKTHINGLPLFLDHNKIKIAKT